MTDPNIEEIKSHAVAFIEWMWENGEYQIAYVGMNVVDPLIPNELLRLATNFAHARAKSLAEPVKGGD